MSNINVERQVISHDLDLTWTHGYKDIICEFDSLSIIKFIKEGVSHIHPYTAIADYIRSLLTMA